LARPPASKPLWRVTQRHDTALKYLTTALHYGTVAGMTTPQNQPEPISERIQALTDAEQAYLARWVAITHPGIAEQALDALTRYRRDHPETARTFLGAQA
jgi:hypothetical protein